MSKFQPITRVADETDYNNLRVAVISDLHIGSSQSHYTRAWNWLLKEIRQNRFNCLIINGDFGCYQETAHPQELTERLRAHLQEALDANPQLKIYMVRGNHDMVRPFHKVLTNMMSENLEHFGLCDILLMGKDSAFIHGDSRMWDQEREIHMPETIRNQARQNAEALVKAGNPPKPWVAPVDACLKKIPEIDRMFKFFVCPQFEHIKRVFIGHIHPEKPMMDIPCNGRKYYVTGASFVGGDCTIMGLQFEQDGTSKIPEIVYSETIRETACGHARS